MYLGKMIEVTREAPANLGTAMKTIIARFEDMKKDPMAILEDGVSANKVEAALATIGIALRNSEGEFRALQDVMDELGMKWSSLTRNQQAYIATVAAGSRQQSRFLALMNNYDRTLDLITESQNSAGAAAQQYATYQDSIAAAQARLTASWEKFYSKIVDNGVIKTAINTLSSLVEVLSKVPPIITVIGVSLSALKIQNLIKSFTTKGGLTPLISSFKDLYDASKANAGSFEELIEISPKIGKGFKGITTSIKQNVKSLWDGVRATAAFIAANAPIIAIGAAVTLAIGGIAYAIYKAGQRANDAAKEISKLNEELSNQQDELKTKEELVNTYDELIRKTERTKEEQEELNNTIQQIGDVYSDAITWMDEMGNWHLNNRDTIESENEAYREQIRLLKNEAFDKKVKFLKETPLSQMTQENTSQAGLSSMFWSQFKGATKNIENLNIDSDEKYQQLEDELYSLYSAYSMSPDWASQIAEMFKKNYGLNLDISGVTSYLNLLERLQQAYIDTSAEIVSATDVRNKEIQRLTVDNWIDNIDYQSVQSGLVASFKEIMNNLSFEEFEAKGEQLKEEFQLMLTKVIDPDDIIEARQAFSDLLDGTINLDQFSDKMKNLGITLSTNFMDGIATGLQNKEDYTHQIAVDAVKAVFGGYGGYENESTETLNAMATLGKDYDIKNSTDAKKLSIPFEELQKLEAEALANGTYDGYDAGVEKIIQDNKLSTYYTELFKEIAESEGEILREELFSKIFDDAQTKIQDFMASYKESIESVLSGDYTKATDAGLTSSDNGVFIDPESGEVMVSIVKTLFDLEKQRNSAAIDTIRAYKDVTNKIQDLKSKNENITAEEKIQLQQLENQKRILEQQYTLLEKIKLNDIQAGWGTSINLAKDYQSNLKSIQSIQETIKEQGFLDVSDMETILNIMPQYAEYFDEVTDKIADTEGQIYTITEENIENMMKAEKAKYDYKLALQQQEATKAYNDALADYNMLIELYGKEADVDYQTTQDKINNRKDEVGATEESAKKTIQLYEQGATGELQVQAQKDDQMVLMFIDALQQMGANYQEFLKQLKSGDPFDFSGIFKKLSAEAVKSDIKVGVNWTFNPESDEGKKQQLIQAMVEEAKARMESAWQKLQSLKTIDVPQLEKLKKSLEKSGKSGDDLAKTMKAAADAIKEATEAAEKLDDILKDLNVSMRDINVDYNPFTDLFEAWEHEWDYYYNIKRLIAQIGTQGQYIDNIISADYISADKKVNAYHAKIGNLLSSMAANDAYIESLRTGMTQTAVELMEDYGQYYKVDPNTGQVYQNDSALKEINDTINQRKEEIYQQQKLQNEKENDLALEEAKLDALEEEKSAYEDILNTLQSQIDSLSGKDDITADLSDIEAEKAKIKADIEVTEDSIKNAKQIIQQMEDDIQDVEVSININEKSLQESEKYVDKMEDKLSEYEQYWDTLNETIAGQQELLQQLTEIYNDYIDTAISTEQELYDAIVENYQDEIDKKKKQYDELKALDNSYLQSVKNSVNQERQIRQDAEKQKSYQQSLQRAQLLQLDTSGAYKAELAQLTKEMESQRQELYDDLVDKQVEALEKEIENRHELYDKEVAALEERLAYMQENAILLWETVNGIVAEGSEKMMSILENTTSYINSSELSRQKQRNTWELNVKKTFDGVKNDTIDMLKGLIDAGNQYITEKLPEVGEAVDDYTLVFQDASNIMDNYNNSLQMTTENLFGGSGVFQNILNSFMSTWNTTTNALTGYTSDWSSLIANLKAATEANVQALEAMHNEGGSIKQLDESLRESAKAMYDDFLEERRRYRNELESLISSIRSNIESAVKAAADAIKNAANSIQGGSSSGSNGSPSGSSSTSYGGTNNTGNSGSASTGSYASGQNEQKFEHWKAWFNYGDGSQPKQMSMGLGKEATITELYNNWLKFLENLRKNKPNATSWGLTYYKQGGLADFTGPAWLDGTKSTPEAVLNPKQTRLFTSMVNSLEKASNNSNINSPLGTSYNIGDINTTIKVDKLDSQTDINRLAMQVEDKIVRDIRNRVSVSITKGV